MSSKSPRNYSGIFGLFAYDKPDRTGSGLEGVGKVGFTTSFLAALILFFYRDGSSLLFNILISVFGLGFLIGLLMFIAVGIHYSGREKGKTSFISSGAYVLRNTFLYLLLPVSVITALIILWAVLTGRPAFR